MLKMLLASLTRHTDNNSDVEVMRRKANYINKAYIYIYEVQNVHQEVKLQTRRSYSLGTSCPSTTHFVSANGERSTSGCTLEN